MVATHTHTYTHEACSITLMNMLILILYMAKPVEPGTNTLHTVSYIHCHVTHTHLIYTDTVKTRVLVTH